MRIRTDGKFGYREDVFDRASDALGASTRTEGIELACIHARKDLVKKQEAIDELSKLLPPEELTRIAEILSTEQVPIEVDVEVSVGPNQSE